MSRLLRIVHILKYSPERIGGVEKYSNFLLESLSDKTIENNALYSHIGSNAFRKRHATSINNTYFYEMFTLLNIFRQPISFLPIFSSFLTRSSIIFVHVPNPFLLIQLFLFKLIFPNFRLIVVHHGDLKKGVFINSFNSCLMRFPGFVSDLIYLSEEHLLRSKEISLLNVPKHFVPLPAVIRSRNLSEKVRRVGFLGRLEKWKGVDYLLHSATYFPDLEFLVGGSGSDELRLRKLSVSLGLSNVRFLGEISPEEKDSLFFDLIDILVLPSISRRESFGISVYEAMERSIPTICSDLDSGVQELIGDGCSLTFAPRDVQGLVRCLHEMQDIKRRAFVVERASSKLSSRTPKSYKDLVSYLSLK